MPLQNVYIEALNHNVTAFRHRVYEEVKKIKHKDGTLIQ